MKRFRMVLVAVWFLLAPCVHAQVVRQGLTVETTQEPDGTYRTVGDLLLTYPAAEVEKKMADFRGYGTWAPRGQDGNDPSSAHFTGQLTGARFREGFLDLIYRINMIWPFGSSGNVVTLVVTDLPPDPGQVRHFRFTLKDPSLIIPDLKGDFSLVDGGASGAKVRLDCRMKLAWFLTPIFPVQAFRTYVANRLVIMIGSFGDAVASDHQKISG